MSENLTQFTSAMFGVDTQTLENSNTKDVIRAEILDLQKKLAEKYQDLRGGSRFNRFQFTDEHYKAIQELYPFLSGNIASYGTDFIINTQNVPMEHLHGGRLGQMPAGAVIYTTMPLYNYSFRINPTGHTLYFTAKPTIEALPQDVCWKRVFTENDEDDDDEDCEITYGHPHENTGEDDSRSLCYGTNPFMTKITNGLVKDTPTLNTWLCETLLWTKSINLDDNYGHPCTPWLKAPLVELQQACEFFQEKDRIKRYTNYLQYLVPEARAEINRDRLHEIRQEILNDKNELGEMDLGNSTNFILATTGNILRVFEEQLHQGYASGPSETVLGFLSTFSLMLRQVAYGSVLNGKPLMGRNYSDTQLTAPSLSIQGFLEDVVWICKVTTNWSDTRLYQGIDYYAAADRANLINQPLAGKSMLELRGYDADELEIDAV